MLPQTEAILCARDSQLRGLALVLDSAELADRVRRAVPDLGVDELRVDYTRYKPGMNCLCRFRIQSGGQELTGYAKAYRDDAAAKLGMPRHPSDSGHREYPGRLLLRDHSTELVFTPLDNKLKGLPQLLLPHRRSQIMRRLLGSDASQGQWSVEELNYKPERRFVGLVSNSAGRRVVVRIYRSTDYEIGRSKRTPTASESELTLPQHLGKTRRRSALALDWLNGVSLASVLPAAPEHEQWIDALAHGLAIFHAQDTSGMPQRLPSDLANKTIANANMISWLAPSLTQQVEQVTSRLLATLPALPVGTALVHGDLHPKQVLLRGRGIGLIDLDEAGRGDPAEDLGLFLAHLDRNSYWLGWSPDFADDAEEQLVTAYVAAGGVVDRREIQIYRAAGLFGLLVHHFRRRDPDWHHRIDQGLQRVSRLMDRRCLVTSPNRKR